MKKINLKKLFNLILLHVSDENFSMTISRIATFCGKNKIKVAGCPLGHGIALDSSINVDEIDMNGSYFNYPEWGSLFFGIDRTLDKENGVLYEFLFSSEWCASNNPESATRKQFLLRLLYVIENETYFDDGRKKSRHDSMYNMEMEEQKLIPFLILA